MNYRLKSVAKIIKIAIKSQDSNAISAYLDRLTEFASKVSADDAISTLIEIIDDVVES